MSDLPFQIPPDVLGFLVLIGLPTFGAWFLSEFVEKEPWFLTLTAAWKSRAVFIILLVLSLISRVSVTVAKGQQLSMQEVYLACTIAFVGYLSSTWYHSRNHDVTAYTSKERAVTAATNAAQPSDNQPKLDGAPQAAG